MRAGRTELVRLASERAFVTLADTPDGVTRSRTAPPARGSRIVLETVMPPSRHADAGRQGAQLQAAEPRRRQALRRRLVERIGRPSPRRGRPLLRRRTAGAPEGRSRPYTTPEPGEPGGESWPAGSKEYLRGGATLWQAPAVDPKLGLLYFSTGKAGSRLVRRRPPRQEPLRRVDRRAGSANRKAQVVLPAGAP